MKKRALVGLAGLGLIAPYHMTAIGRLPDEFHLAAVCDPEPKTHRGAPCPVFHNVEEMLDSVRVDVVAVAAPPSAHAAIAKAALIRGVDVLLEKPPTLTQTEYDELELLATKKRALLYSAFHFAFGREVIWFLEHRSRLEADMGPLCAVKAGFFDPYLSGTRVEDRALLLNGSWADSGPNALSVVARLVDCYATVERHLTRLPSYEHDVAAECSLSLTTGDHVHGLAVVTTSWCLGLNHKSTLLSYAEAGASIRLDHSRERVTRLQSGGDQRILFATPSPATHLQAHYDGVYRDFARALVERSDNRVATRRLLNALWWSGPHNA